MRTPDIIACSRVTDVPVPPGPGGVQSTCEDCLAAVWVAPDARIVAHILPMTPIVCIECMFVRVENEFKL